MSVRSPRTPINRSPYVNEPPAVRDDSYDFMNNPGVGAINGHHCHPTCIVFGADRPLESWPSPEKLAQGNHLVGF